MKIDTFGLESWLNPLDPLCRYNLGASCVKALTVREMLDYVGEDSDAVIEQIANMSLHYGHFDGLLRLRKAIAGLFRNADPELVITTHGGTGANNMVLHELLEPGDNVVVITPTYQQHTSIPETLGVEVRKVRGTADNDYLPGIDEISAAFDDKTKMIIATSPSNPAGIYIDETLLRQIADLARSTGAYVLIDEMYRGLDDDYMPSIIDIYEKGIHTSSMSKVYSMAGTRVGWVVVNEPELFERIFNRRSFDTIAASLIVRPQINRVCVGARSQEGAAAFAESLPAQLKSQFGVDASGVTFEGVGPEGMAEAVAASDCIITITPSREPIIDSEWVQPGTHISCVGADMSGKQEVASALVARSSVFCDDALQCSHVGEIEIPISQGVFSADDVVGEIGQVISGQLPGRTSDDEITLFDATGIALLDLVTAKLALERAAGTSGAQLVTI